MVVTAAVIKKENKFLICQRPKKKNCELLWEFPGGKVELNETNEECIIRECKEELNIDIKIEKLIGNIENKNLNIYFYLCSIVNNEPVCIEHNKIQWSTIEEISQLPLCPTDEKILSLVKKYK